MLSSNGEMRDLADIIDELGLKWSTLDRNTKAYLATSIAGTRQQSRFYALMNNYDRTLELVSSSINSAGMAQQQFSLYSKSLEASTNRLVNEWQKFFNSLAQGNGVISIFTNELEKLMKVVNFLGPATSGVGVLSLIGSFRKGVNEFNNLSKIAKEKDSKAYAKSFSNLSTKDQETVATLRKTAKAQETLTTNIITNGSKATDIIKKAKVGFEQFGATAKFALGQAGSALTSLAASMGVMITMQLVLQLVGSAINAVRTNIGANTEEFQKASETAQSNSENINALSSEYKDLSQKVNKTAEEQERLKDIAKEVLAIDVELGEQLLNNASNYETNVSAMKKYAEEQKKLAAQQAVLTEKAQASWVNNMFIVAEGAFELLGGENVKKMNQAEGQSSYRRMAQGRGVEAGLDETQTSLLQDFTTKSLKNTKDWGLVTFKASAETWDQEVKKYIASLQKLTDTQLEAYNKLTQNIYSGENTLTQVLEDIEGSILPDEQKRTLKEKTYTKQSELSKVIDTTDLDSDTKLKAMAATTSILTQDMIDKLFNIDTSTMDNRDQQDYFKGLAETLGDTSLWEGLTNTIKSGDNALEFFTNNANISSIETGMFIDAIKGASTDIEKLSKSSTKAIEALNKIGNIDMKQLASGEVSQADILKEIIADNLSFSDITITNGVITVNTATTVEVMKAQVNAIFKPLFEDIKIKQQESENLTNENVNTSLKKNRNELNRLEYYKKLQEDDRKNNQPQLLAAPTQQIKTKTGGYIKDETYSLYRNEKNFPTEYLQRNINDSASMSDEYKQRVRSVVAEREAKITTQDTSNSNYKERLDYLSEINREIEKEQDNVSKAASNTQDLTNSTYKLLQWQEEKNRLANEGDDLKNAKDKLNIDEDITNVQKEYGKVLDANKALQKETNSYLNKQNAALEKSKDLMLKKANVMSSNSKVFDALQYDTTMVKELDAVTQAIQLQGNALSDIDKMRTLVAQNPALIDAITTENGYWEFNQQKLMDVAKTSIEASNAKIDSEIAYLESQKVALGESNVNVDNWEEEQLNAMGGVIYGTTSLSSTVGNSIQDEATNLGLSEQSWITWSDTVQNAIKNAADAQQNFNKIVAGDSLAQVTVKKTAGSTTDKTAKFTELNPEQKKEEIKNYLKNAKLPQDTNGAKANIDRQIELLEGLKGSNNLKIKDLGGYLKGGSGGSAKELEKYLAQFEKFFNILQKIEAIELRLNDIRAKRATMDKVSEYYIDDIARENKLLQDQIQLYSQLEEAQAAELNTLRQKIEAQYNQYAYFENGIIQLRVKEINAVGEAEIENIKNFEELVNEYKELYSSRSDSANKAYELEATMIDNIIAMYDKYIAKIEKVNEKYQKLIEKSDFNITMGFGDLTKFDLFEKKIGSISESLLNYQKALTGAQAQMNNVAELFKLTDFQKYYKLDETGKYQATDEFNNVPTTGTIKGTSGKTYDAAQVRTFVTSLITGANKLNEVIQSSEEGLMSAYEALRGMVDERISLITDYFSKAKEEMDKFFAIYQKQINKLQSNQDMFGQTPENITQRFNLILSAAQKLNSTISGLEPQLNKITKNITDNYSKYIKIVEGQVYFNTQAIENATELSDVQKAEFLQLKAAYEGITGLLDEANLQLDNYISAIVEMEKARRDALINITNQVKEALISAAQMEIDDLSKKYSKMTELDDRYYTELTKKIQEMRDERSKGQDATTLAQQQQRLTLLKTDTSGAYTKEIQTLQANINQQLQAMSDKAIDDELKRLEEEKTQRAEDRDLQVRQLEEQMNFRIENGIYWEMANKIIDQGNAAIVSTILEGQKYYEASEVERKKLIEDMNNEINVALTELNDNLSIMNGVTPLEEQIMKLINESGIPIDDTGIVKSIDDMMKAMDEFNGTLNNIFQLLDKEFTKNTAGSGSTGITNPSAPGAVAPSPPANPPATSTPISPAPPKLAVGSYVQVKPGTRWYYNSAGAQPSGIARSGVIRYTSGNAFGYNIEGLGWIKKSNIVGYSKGGLATTTGPAMLHGTPAKPERVLDYKQTKSFDNLVNTLTKTNHLGRNQLGNISQNVKVDEINIVVDQIATNDQVDNMIKKVKKEIVTTATSNVQFPIGGKR